MSQEPDRDFRPIKQILDSQASLGPLPAVQILAGAIIALAAYFIINGIFGGLFQDEFNFSQN
jgi:hypothetical protein